MKNIDDEDEDEYGSDTEETEDALDVSQSDNVQVSHVQRSRKRLHSLNL